MSRKRTSTTSSTGSGDTETKRILSEVQKLLATCKKKYSVVNKRALKFDGTLQADGWPKDVLEQYIVKCAEIETIVQLEMQKRSQSDGFCPGIAIWITSQTSEYVTVVCEIDIEYTRKDHYGATKKLASKSSSELLFVMSGVQSSPTVILLRDTIITSGARVKLTATVKVLHYNESDPESNNSGEETAVVIVEDEEISVNIPYISQWSRFFPTYFASNMKERKEGKYPIQDCSAKDFRELLAVIYPSSKPITESNVEKLLELADRFLMPPLTRKCECFLVDSIKHSIAEFKLIQLADQYNLEFVKAIILERLSTTALIRAKLPAGEAFNELSEGMRSMIHERYFELDCRERAPGR